MAEADPPARTVTLGSGVAAVDAAAWDALAGGGNPFVSHDFLTLLEESGSVGPGTGWQAAPILIEDAGGALVAAAPAYLKSHSQGEYVFDHAWADAWARAGGDYYPKLQIAAPFTPVPGPRLLAQDEAAALLLIRGAEAVVRQNGLSSAHATFVAPEQLPLFEAADWLRAQVEQLTREREAAREKPWAVGDAPEAFVASQLRAIVGIEIPILDLRGKWKASQNRNDADREGVIAGLGDDPMAEIVRRAKAP